MQQNQQSITVECDQSKYCPVNVILAAAKAVESDEGLTNYQYAFSVSIDGRCRYFDNVRGLKSFLKVCLGGSIRVFRNYGKGVTVEWL